MPNLIVCCDGTWNTADERTAGVPVPTNVVRLYNALAESDAGGVEQKRYYHPGVGSDGSLVAKIKGGAAGVGLDKNIMSAYRWLGANYRRGDKICLFGFSRGAFTVRSLGGMIACCGLLDLTEPALAENDVWKRVQTAYDKGYRKRAAARSAWADAGWTFHSESAAENDVSIHLIGVWDTVGALGIPDDMALFNILDDPTDYAFHDTRLGKSVRHARHAVAMDEQRETFTPTLWVDAPAGADVRQIWFPGVHSDVGGGYPETGLSDGALRWMIDEAAALGIAFDDDMVGQVRPDARAVLHDSCTGVFKLLRTRPRSVPNLDGPPAAGMLHESVLDRHRKPPITHAPYRRTVTLGPGEKRSVAIYAVQPWNETGIYLEQGARYRFEARGQWLDRDIRLGPEGDVGFDFHASELAHLAGTLLGQTENLFKKLTHNQSADFAGTKRNEDMPWFALVGVIANGGNPVANQGTAAHETFMIGKGCDFPGQPGATVTKPGYLYCYANDAWHFYDNNHGSVELTIERLV